MSRAPPPRRASRAAARALGADEEHAASLGQIVGKVRMATTAPRNHWWHVPLYVDVRGLTTRRLHAATAHLPDRLRLRRPPSRRADVRRAVESFALADGLSVAAFDEQLHARSRRSAIDVEIRESPFGVPMTTPFPTTPSTPRTTARRSSGSGGILDWSDAVFEEFSGWYCGKTSPVHLFWHSFDLAVTRFGGRRAPALADADPVTREAYTHEVVSFGFWAGDDNVREPPTTPTRRRSLQACGSARCSPAARWVDRGPGRWRSCRTRRYAPRTTRERRCSTSSTAPTGPARAPGWDRERSRRSCSPTLPI